MLRSRYTYVQRDGAVLIEDMIGQVSVKNDIATVVIDLVKREIDVDRVIIVYLDGTGLWDRARTKGGAFACFEVLGELDGPTAVAVCRKRDAAGRRPADRGLLDRPRPTAPAFPV